MSDELRRSDAGAALPVETAGAATDCALVGPDPEIPAPDGAGCMFDAAGGGANTGVEWTTFPSGCTVVVLTAATAGDIGTSGTLA